MIILILVYKKSGKNSIKAISTHKHQKIWSKPNTLIKKQKDHILYGYYLIY